MRSEYSLPPLGPFEISGPRTLQILPAFDAPGVCADYDADCLKMTERQRVLCYLVEPPPRGVCPFMD
jgi:hypothetical protein